MQYHSKHIHLNTFISIDVKGKYTILGKYHYSSKYMHLNIFIVIDVKV